MDSIDDHFLSTVQRLQQWNQLQAELNKEAMWES